MVRKHRMMSVCAIAAGMASLTIAGAASAFQVADPADESTLELNGVVRDFRAFNVEGGHPDFGVNPPEGPGLVLGSVAPELDAEGKPVFTGEGRFLIEPYRNNKGDEICPLFYDPAKGDSAGSWGAPSTQATTSNSTFRQWFRNIPGINAAARFPIVMQRNGVDGNFVFEGKLDTQFARLYGGLNKNHEFTYELNTQLLYREGMGDELIFTADDDFWVFLDGKLIVDLGGLHAQRTQVVHLDRLDWLQNGEMYEMTIFYANRKRNASYLRIETSLKLRPGRLPDVMGIYD